MSGDQIAQQEESLQIYVVGGWRLQVAGGRLEEYQLDAPASGSYEEDGTRSRGVAEKEAMA